MLRYMVDSCEEPGVREGEDMYNMVGGEQCLTFMVA